VNLHFLCQKGAITKKLKMRVYNFNAPFLFVRIMKRVARSSGSLSKLSSETARGSGARATGASLRMYVRPMRLAGAFATAMGAGTGAAREGAKRAKNMRKKKMAVNAGRAIMLEVMFERDWWCVSWIRRVGCVCTARVWCCIRFLELGSALCIMKTAEL